MPKKMTEARVKEIVNYLENEYSDERKTANGLHTRYAEVVPKELGLEINFKPAKGTFVKISGRRVSIGDLNKDELQNVIDNFENLQAIGDALGTQSVSSSAKII